MAPRSSPRGSPRCPSTSRASVRRPRPLRRAARAATRGAAPAPRRAASRVGAADPRRALLRGQGRGLHGRPAARGRRRAGAHRRPAAALGDAALAAVAPVPGDPPRQRGSASCPTRASRPRADASGPRTTARPRATMRDVLVATVAESYEDELARSAARSTLVWGSDDSTAPVANAVAPRTSCARATLVVLDGVGHLVPTEAPDPLVAAVEAMLRGAALNPLGTAAVAAALARRHPRVGAALAARRPARALPTGRGHPVRRALVDVVVGAPSPSPSSRSRPRSARSRSGRSPRSTGVVAVVGPLGLSVRGRTSRLAWTRRLRTLAAASARAARRDRGRRGASRRCRSRSAAGIVVVTCLVVDAAAALLVPIEHRLGERWVRRARRRLLEVAPAVVAITGSYGKTSTKHHLAELLSGGRRRSCRRPGASTTARASPMAINEHLGDGTEVFIAEMGTYGPGEIRSMCAWCPPDVAVLTAIGPVHLERFGTLERIVEAKAEITERARVVVSTSTTSGSPSSRTGSAPTGREVLTAGVGARGRSTSGVGVDRGTLARRGARRGGRSSRARSPASSRPTSPARSAPGSPSASTPTCSRRGSSASPPCPTG